MAAAVVASSHIPSINQEYQALQDSLEPQAFPEFQAHQAHLEPAEAGVIRDMASRGMDSAVQDTASPATDSVILAMASPATAASPSARDKGSSAHQFADLFYAVPSARDLVSSARHILVAFIADLWVDLGIAEWAPGMAACIAERVASMVNQAGTASTADLQAAAPAFFAITQAAVTAVWQVLTPVRQFRTPVSLPINQHSRKVR